MVAQIGVVADVPWEVHLLAASLASFQEPGVSLSHLPEIMQKVVPANAVLITRRAQHVRGPYLESQGPAEQAPRHGYLPI